MPDSSRNPRCAGRLCILALLALTLAPPAAAQTLQQAFAEALRSNPDLQAARAQLEAARAAVAAARAGWLPQVTASGSYGFTSQKNTPPGAASSVSSDFEPLAAGVTVSQSLFEGGRVVSQQAQSRANFQAARAGLHAAEQRVLLNAATAYFNVLRDQAIVSLNQNNLVVLNRRLEAVRNRFEVGELTRTDVAQSEARLSRARAQRAAARAQLVAARAAYRRVVGRAPARLAFARSPRLPVSEQRALQIARRQNPDLAAARFSASAFNFGINTARAALLPSLNLEANYGYSEEPAASLEKQESTSVTGRLTIPIFRGGASLARLRQARREADRARFELLAAARQIEEQVANAWEALRAARAQLASAREEERATGIALEGVRQEAEVGQRTTLDVLDAQQELLDAQVARATALRDGQVTAYGLLAAVGTLTANQIEWLAPANPPPDANRTTPRPGQTPP